jgi:hypothetical protein
MKRTITFHKGEVYFSVGFYDSEFKLPMIDTYVFIGIEKGDYLFIDAAKYILNSNNEIPASAHYLTLANNSNSYMLDRKNLIEWLAIEHTPKLPALIEYEYTAV